MQLTAFENAYAERWVRLEKKECLSKIILFGERSLRPAVSKYVEHYHAEHNRQGKDNPCCSPAIQASAALGPCNAVSDWVGYCVITIRRRRGRARPGLNPEL